MVGLDDQPSAADGTGITGVYAPNPEEAAVMAQAVAADLGPRYQVQEYLGRGAFATVWKVFDRIASEVVAIKRFEARIQEGGGFYRELRALFLLRHERIVRVINLAEAANGTRHLVLEYCEGGSLRPAISRARRTGERCHPGRARVLAVQLAEGLAAAHRQGLVHRDLKPENILFETLDPRPFGGQARIKLADFGLARAFSSVALREDDGVLRPLSGSPAYMAPEQFDGTYTQASDVYALGVILYELLHGQTPFLGNATELAYQHLRTPPVVDPGLPERWRALLARLLDKEPGRRPAPAELIESLGRRDTDRRHHPARSAPGVFARLPMPAFDVLTDAHGPSGVEFAAVTADGLLRFHPETGEPRGRVDLPGLRHAVRGPDGGLWLAAGSQVSRLDRDGRPERMQDVGAPVEALAACVLPGALPRFATAALDTLTDHQPPDGQRWARPLPGRGLRPQLVRLGDGHLVCSEGPLNPRLLVLDLTGSVSAVVPLPGICWQLGAWPHSFRLFALVLVNNALAPFRIDLDHGAVEALLPVPDLIALTVGPTGPHDLFGLCGNGNIHVWRALGEHDRLLNLGLRDTTYKALATDGAAFGVLCRAQGSWWIQFRNVHANAAGGAGL